MGGGTGSGALPVIAHALRERGILTIVVVTKPFAFEGKRRARIAEQAIEDLKKEVDTLIVIPNQKLLDVVDQDVSMIDAFAMINNVLGQSVRSISDIISKPGHINVDFADVRAIMKDKGLAIMGTGKAKGENRAQQATLNAIASPLLENMNVQGASGVLLNITGGRNLRLHEVSQAASIIYEQADSDAVIILGSVIDENLEEEVIVTVIATGFVQKQPEQIALPERIEPAIRGNFEQENMVLNKVSNEKSAEELLDFQDLDVPTFMRNEAK
jgi:cell division protein FtsZ